MDTPENFTYSVIPYRGHEAEILELRNRNRRIAQTRAYMDWRYLGEETGHEPLVFILRDENGSAGAMAAAIFRRYQVDGMPALFAVLGDIAVNKEHRGRGLSSRLFRHINEHLAAHKLAGFVMPNDAAERGLTSSGWRTVGKLFTLVCVVNAEEKIRGVLPALARPVAGALRATLKTIASLKSTRGIMAKTPPAFDADFEKLWLRIEKKGHILRDRSLATLRWRYEQQPGMRHAITMFHKESEFVGYAISDTMTPGDCLISDFVVEVPELFKPCMALFLKSTMQDAAVRTIRMTCNEGSEHLGALRGFGFVKRKPTTVFQIQNFAHPLALKPGAWFIAAGDKDA